MKLRAKIILTTASLALSCALLAGCGSKEEGSAQVDLSAFFRFHRFFCRVL